MPPNFPNDWSFPRPPPNIKFRQNHWLFDRVLHCTCGKLGTFFCKVDDQVLGTIKWRRNILEFQLFLAFQITHTQCTIAVSEIFLSWTLKLQFLRRANNSLWFWTMKFLQKIELSQHHSSWAKLQEKNKWLKDSKAQAENKVSTWKKPPHYVIEDPHLKASSHALSDKIT